jgi:hypothetical protein
MGGVRATGVPEAWFLWSDDETEIRRIVVRGGHDMIPALIPVDGAGAVTIGQLRKLNRPFS